ncbi:MAG TPA: hypothetical protein VI789_03710 [Dehalococcoidia bacterium]|nr:hypothetical protein [Dehalococcoidia bacterium]
MEPGDLHLRVAIDGLLLGRTGNLDEYVDARRAGQRLNDVADRGQSAVIAGNQVPLGVWVWAIGRAGAGDGEDISWLGPFGPIGAGTAAAVQDEVDFELSFLGTPAAGRVRAARGPLLAWDIDWAVGTPGREDRPVVTWSREEHLDVLGGAVGCEPFQLVPNDRDSDHMRRDAVHPAHAHSTELRSRSTDRWLLLGHGILLGVVWDMVSSLDITAAEAGRFCIVASECSPSGTMTHRSKELFSPAKTASDRATP